MPKRRKAKRKHQPPKRRWKTSTILTWAGLACLAAAIVVLGFFAFNGDAETTPRRVRQTPVVTDERLVTVDVVDNDFEPKHLTVRAGAEITWDFKGRAAHDVTEDRGAFESGTLGRGDEFIMTFDEPGTYYYYCTLHHSMQGTVVVQP
jgi:plastocyanin